MAGLFGLFTNLLLGLLMYVGTAALLFYVLYRVVRRAVKKGILDAHREVGGSFGGQGMPPGNAPSHTYATTPVGKDAQFRE